MLANQVETELVAVAKEDIPPFTKITEDNLEMLEKVVAEVPSDAVKDRKEVNFDNAYASDYGFMKGAPIRKSYITTAEESKLGTSVGLKEGMREIGVRTDLAQSAGNDVKPGVYVDAIAFIRDDITGLSIKKIDPKLKNIKVLKLLNSEGTVPDPNVGNSLIPAVVVLEVSSKQAEELMAYQETGKVYFLPSGDIK